MKYILCFENEQKMNEFVDAHKFTKEEPMVLGSKDGADVVYSSVNVVVKKLTKVKYKDGSVVEYDIDGVLGEDSIDNK